MYKKYPKKSDLQKELTRLKRVNAALIQWKRRWYTSKKEMILEINNLKNKNFWLSRKLEMENK